MSKKQKRLFCEINPTCYAISMQKEILKRHIKNILSKEKMAKEFQSSPMDVLVSEHSSYLIKRAKGIDPVLQENKVVNIALASSKINGIVIHPGESFSFWGLVGKVTKRKGYKEGRVLQKNKLVAGMGGGLCNLANTINLLVIHSPLTITEFHKHSDALAPDGGTRVPLSAGTSVCYNNLDYRFKNNTDQSFQLLLKCENDNLYAELRCQKDIPWEYRIVEEDHHFAEKNGKFYRNSKIYREVMNKSDKQVIEKMLLVDNHSEVMFDYDLIPKEQIRK